MDEAGFNLEKRRRRGCDIMARCAIIEVPGQHGGNVTICTPISSYGDVHLYVTAGPYNTDLLLTALDGLWDASLGHEQRGVTRR